MHDAVMGIVPDDSVALAGDHARKARIKTYIETIRRKVGEAPPAGGPLKDSYTNYLAKRFADGREHNIFTTNDIPFDQFRFGNWGSSVPSRTTGDALAISNGEKMMGSLFGKFEGHMDEADFYKAVTEIKSTMAAADPGVGLNAAGFLNNARYAFYRESNFATRTGLFGRMMTSETVIELSEWASKLPGIRKLTKGKIPGWMWGNEAQQIVGAGAERLSASDIWTNTREADEKLLLPKTHHPLGWSGSGYKQGQGFTKEEMRVRYNANILKDLLPQAIFTVSPIAVGLIILQALKEESESGGGGHH